MPRIPRLIVLFAASTMMSGCVYALGVAYPPHQEYLRLVSPTPDAYAVAMDGAQPSTSKPVPTDGGVTLDIPRMGGSCDRHFLLFRISKSESPFDRKIIQLFRGNEKIQQLSLNELAALPLDSLGYRLLQVKQ